MPGADDKTHEDTALRDALGVFDRLEAALRQGDDSPIEACLAKVAMADRPAVFAVLVSLEVAARRGRGESPRESDYLQRFPDLATIVRAAFARSHADIAGTRVSESPDPSLASTRLLTAATQDIRNDLPRTQSGRNENDRATRTYHAQGETASGFGPGERGERYSLSSYHKGGGLGEVWRARDHQLGRDVALKRLRDECVSHATIRARFLREAWITGQLQHPGIVPVFELGMLPDVDGPFYTMRFIEGPTFSAAVAEFHKRRRDGTTGSLDLRKLLGSFVSACQVVAYAHSRGVIHRDLKGDNIVLGDFGEVIVLDWGIAKIVGGNLVQPVQDESGAHPGGFGPADGAWDETIDGSVLGTPAYMAPEQAQGRIEELDERSDVYGLGSILYEILTGEPPFRGKSEDVLRRVVHEPPVNPRHKVPDAPPALEAICLKCLAKNPVDRYPSALALADDIQRFLAGEPVSVHRENWSIKARRWAWRHRTLVTATLATLVVATGCLAVATVLLRIANGQAVAARREAEDHLSLTLRAVDSFFTRVADAPSLKTFGLEKFQKDVLTEAEKVIKQLHDVQIRASDVSVEHGRCCLRLSEITAMLGEPQSSLRYALEARSTFATLAETELERRTEQERGLAESLDALGLAYAGVYRLDQAEAAHEQAATLWEKLAAASPASPDLAFRLAVSLNRRGRLLCLKLGDAPGALQVLSVSRDRCDQLVGHNPESADYVRERAKATVLTGVAMSSPAINNTEGATPLFEEALAQFEKLAALEPANTDVQADLVDACTMIAAAYSNARLEGRITKIYDQVRNNARRLAREHPDVPLFAENNALIETLHSMRIALSGDHARAVALLDVALKGAGDSGLARMFAACCLSVASDVASRDPGLAARDRDRDRIVESYQKRAVELLREARKTGLFIQPHQLEGIKSKDKDLEPLRNRDDFRALVDELEHERNPRAISPAGDPGAAGRSDSPR